MKLQTLPGSDVCLNFGCHGLTSVDDGHVSWFELEKNWVHCVCRSLEGFHGGGYCDGAYGLSHFVAS